MEYARLMTMNWWIELLLFTLLQAAIILSDMMANFIFCVNIWRNNGAQGALLPLEFRILFPLLFVVLDTNQFRICWNLAGNDVDSLKTSGDWVDSRMLDEGQAFIAMVVFYFLNVPQTVTEIVRILHPMKNKQPFAALKCDGHRCFVVGWPSKHAFRVSDYRGRDRTLPPFIWCKSVLTLFRLTVAFKTGDAVSAVTCIPGLLALMVQTYMLIVLVGNRREHWKWLKRQMETHNVPVEEVLDPNFVKGLPARPRALCDMAIKHFEANKIPLHEFPFYRQMVKINFFNIVALTAVLTIFAFVVHGMH